MPKALTKVIYKPDSQSTDEFVAIVNPEPYKKWKDGNRTIPLAEVVDSFEIFHSGTGNQGILGRPSHQELDNTFGTHKDVDVMQIVLEKGTAQAGDGIHSGGSPITNVARGSATVDTKGRGNTSGI